jgi:Domain of Unknown Function with PDB structure (DUF3862)
MKNSLNLVLVILFFIVLGCNCQKFQDAVKQAEKDVQTNSTPTTSTTPATDASPTNTSSAAISKEKYEQIKNGMTKAEVEKILGGPGDEMSSSSSGGYSFAMYQWKGENFSAITVMFSNGKVSTKSQYGLK